MKRNEIDRAAIEAHTAEYLARGGTITVVPYLATNEERIQLKRDPKSKERSRYVTGEKEKFNV